MSSEEDEGPSRGKGRPRGKRGDNKGGNRGSRGNRGRRGNKHHKGGDYNRYGGNYRYNGDRNRQYENDYNPNFDRSRRQNDDEDYEEDYKGKEKSYANDNDNDDDNYYYGNRKHKNKNKDSQNNSNYYNEEYKNKNKSKTKSVHKEKKTFLSFSKLKELSAKEETSDIIEYFHNNDEIFDEIKKKQFESERCYLLMNIIERMSELNSEPVLIISNKIIDNTPFIQVNIAYFLNEKAFENEAYLNFLYDVIKFLNKCLIINTKSKKIDINLNDHKRT